MFSKNTLPQLLCTRLNPKVIFIFLCLWKCTRLQRSADNLCAFLQKTRPTVQEACRSNTKSFSSDSSQFSTQNLVGSTVKCLPRSHFALVSKNCVARNRKLSFIEKHPEVIHDTVDIKISSNLRNPKDYSSALQRCNFSHEVLIPSQASSTSRGGKRFRSSYQWYQAREIVESALPCRLLRFKLLLLGKQWRRRGERRYKETTRR